MNFATTDSFHIKGGIQFLVCPAQYTVFPSDYNSSYFVTGSQHIRCVSKITCDYIFDDKLN